MGNISETSLVRFEILRLFGNTLTADHMYSCYRWEKLPQQIQTPLLRSEILGVFRNTLLADHIYSPHRCEKLLQQVQMLLSQKRRTFSKIFIAFLESTQNIAHSERKDQFHRLDISEVTEQDKCSYFNARKFLF